MNEKMDTIGHVYFIQNSVTGNIKIGRAKDIEKRLKALQSASDCPLRLLFSLDVHKMVTEERTIHERFKDYRIIGEWFRFEGELYDYVHELISNRIKSSQEWKIEQEFIRKELIHSNNKSKYKHVLSISKKFIQKHNKRKLRELRKKKRKLRADRLLHKK
jgi:hypothetical protein